MKMSLQENVQLSPSPIASQILSFNPESSSFIPKLDLKLSHCSLEALKNIMSHTRQDTEGEAIDSD